MLGQAAKRSRTSARLRFIDKTGEYSTGDWGVFVRRRQLLPSAMGASLLSPPIVVAKLASWWLAGWLPADGWRRMDAEVMLFTVGNLAWMAATVGLPTSMHRRACA